jgi:hypothetical protein
MNHPSEDRWKITGLLENAPSDNIWELSSQWTMPCILATRYGYMLWEEANVWRRWIYKDWAKATVHDHQLQFSGSLDEVLVLNLIILFEFPHIKPAPDYVLRLAVNDKSHRIIIDEKPGFSTIKDPCLCSPYWIIVSWAMFSQTCKVSRSISTFCPCNWT